MRTAPITPRLVTPFENLKAQGLQPTDFHRSDSGNAQLLARLYDRQIRYDHRRRCWFIWRDHCWRRDTDGEATRLAQEAVEVRYLWARQVKDPDEKRKGSRERVSAPLEGPSRPRR